MCGSGLPAGMSDSLPKKEEKMVENVAYCKSVVLKRKIPSAETWHVCLLDKLAILAWI